MDYLSNISTNINTCFFSDTNEVEVSDVIRSLPNKGNAVYDIKMSILQKVVLKISPVIAFLYNICLASGLYPDKLKLASVVPIYKSGLNHDISNHRPISNLSS